MDFSPQVPRGAVYPPGGAPSGGAFGHSGRHGRRGDGAVRSAQLDEFRANKSRKWELRDIFGYIVEFSGDQHGSRFIQQKLETANGEEMEIVFDEIVPQYAIQLMQDVFGNYVVQKLFEFGTPAQKARLVATMEGQALGLSLQMYGCRVAIEYTTPEQQAVFVQELSPSVLRCVKDANGNHVIQKIIEHVVPERLGFVTAFRGSVYELSTHPYGCRVLQRCFEYLPDDQTRPLLDELHKYVSNLMIDQFGNYVVQFVLEHGKPQDRAMIIAKLNGQMNNMAKHKFASNVCEKALVTADADSRRQLIDEIMTPKQDGLSPLMGLMKDSFGNYVLQRALTVAEGEQKEQLISKVRPHLVNMRRYSSAYSKHLSASTCFSSPRSALERLLEKCSGTPAPATESAHAEGTAEPSSA
ncbi:ARM repeat-containing protein [Epithele typhae]|uniref:ARM repeat-containing protein n=1 Tax=Epithele typhae TaxID=378194 RepID=UPI002007EB4E|nr:ARM repeat-containing protein [Epithele typhae]KAH9946032.1 ARM repeat-containing protein [Epithele typhae]